MLKKQNGFTLLEVIISVIIIAISSIVILKAFYSADTLNERADNLDVANLILSQAIDVSKNVTSFDDFFNNSDIFEQKVVEINSSDFTNVLTVYVYYDKDWNMINVSNNNIPKNAEFIFKYELFEEKLFYEDEALSKIRFGDNTEIETTKTKGILYKIVGTVNINKPPIFSYANGILSQTELTSITGSKYLGNTIYEIEGA